MSFARHAALAASLTLALAGFAGVSLTVRAQQAEAIHVGNEKITGVVDDWTHHHHVFSDPGTADDALRNGTFGKWFTITNDPRYVMQQLMRGHSARGSAADDVARYQEARRSHRDPGPWGWESHKPEQPGINKDWSMAMGPGAKVGAGNFPAKYSFNATSSSPLNCASATTPDFVVYNTSLAGTSSQASIVAYYNLYAGTGPVCTGQVPMVYWAFNTGGTIQTSVVLSKDGSQVAFVQTPSSGNAQLVLLKWAKAPTGRNVTNGTPNVITSGSTNFTVAAGTPLTSMDVGAVIAGTGIPANDTIAKVTSTTAGTLYTAATGTGTAGGTLSISADAGGPDTLTAVGSSSYYNCPAPCMTTLSFSGTTISDTISSPYYDYTTDTLYVGDAQGGLHKFTPVFYATLTTPPAESGTPWVSVTSSALSSPVLDSSMVPPTVFVGDGSGYLWSIVASSGAKTKSVQVAVSPGIVDGPIVDSTNGLLYATVAKDNSSTLSPSGCNSAACSGVIQLSESFGSSTTFNESVMGVAPSSNTVYDGDFDNLYWTSTGVNSGTGNMYVATSTGANFPKLVEIPISAKVLQTGAPCQSGYQKPPNSTVVVCSSNIDNPMVSSAATDSPVTEIYNGTTDYIFASVSANGNLTGCSGNCIYSWDTTSALGASAAPHAGALETGGTSGISIDNISSTNGAAQIYFSTLSNGTCATSGSFTSSGCAVQASQASLSQ